MTDDLVKRLRHVFADTPEILSWIDTSTYTGAETREHVAGMFETMLSAADRIEKLEEALKEILSLGSWGANDLARTVAREALEGKEGA